MSAQPTEVSVVTISPRNVRSVAGVLAYSCILIGCVAYAIASILDGYWLSGTYGYLVLAVFVAGAIGTVQALPVLWAQIVRRDPVIGVMDRRLFYMQRGRKPVELAAVAQVATERIGLMPFVLFLDSTGQELGRYPLLFVQHRQSALSRLSSAIGSPSSTA